MATISALTENFETGPSGAVVTTSNTIFDNKSGTGSVTFSNDAHEGALSMQVSPVADNVLLRADFTAVSTLWYSFYFKLTTAPATTTAITNWYSAATKIGDMRLDSTGAISIRDNNTTIWTSAALAPNVWHRIAIKVVPNTATGHRVKIYSGANLDTATASQDSGNLVATAVAVAAVDNIRFGLISAETASFRIDRLRADDAMEPAGLGGTPLVAGAGTDQAAVEPYNAVTLTGTASGGTAPYAYSWSQVGGSPSVTLSGTGASRTFVAPATLNGTTLTFQLSVTDSVSATSNDTVDVTMLVHNEFTRTSGGQWIPYRTRNRAGGNWS